MIIVISGMNILEQPLYADTVSMWAYAVALGTVVFSLLVHSRFLWNLRISSAAILCSLIGVSLGLVIVSGLPVFIIILIFLIQTYRLFSLFRVIKNRVNSQALRNRSLRSELVLSVCLLVVLIIEQLGLADRFSLSELVLIIASVQFVAAIIFFKHAKEMETQTNIKMPKKFDSDSSLPSITLAIPARNETDELNECLRSILQTNYPKLEVLVVDDCSQDNTSDIIKKFAHQGVRFISGKTPPQSWLAKNYAYHQLLDEAGGKYVIFCGTDVRYEPDSLRIIMQSVVDAGYEMASILPMRGNKFDRHYLLQPMRYWRELAIPRIFDKTPPVLSTCWIAKRSFLDSIGGFAAHKKTIRPERILSRIANSKMQYKFARSSSGLGISSVKNISAQWNTATRTRYPELKNRPENIFFYSIMYFVLLFGVPLTFMYSIYAGDALSLLLSAASTLLLLLTHNLINMLSTGKVSLLKLITFPISVVLEVVVSNYSMWAYEFSEVIWKGRNVCLPVLQTNLTLPKLDAELNISVVGDENRES